MLLLKTDLYTHLDQEVIDEITGADDNKVTTLIKEMEDTAKAYLNRYDLDALFGAGDNPPETKNTFLMNIIKDMVCWLLVKKASPNVDMEAFRLANKEAMRTLEKISAADGLSPNGWQIKPVNPETGMNEGSRVEYSSNKRRRNNWS